MIYTKDFGYEQKKRWNDLAVSIPNTVNECKPQWIQMEWIFKLSSMIE